MKSTKKRSEVTFNIKTESRKDFFSRGKHIAKMLDEGNKISSSRVISFEDPEDLKNFITKAKFALIALLRKKPDSISGLANKLHRSRAAIDKDVQQLESVGIVISEYIRNPGHGRCRIVKAVNTTPIKLCVETII